MPIIEGKPDVTDIMSLQMSQVYSGDVSEGQGLLDPNSPEYNPEMMPRDPVTGTAFTSSVGDPESPDYDPDDTRTKYSLWDIAKDDWVTTKLIDFAARQAFDDDPNFVPPWGDLNESYDPYINAFEAVKSEDEWYYVKNRIDQSLEMDAQMSEFGFKDGASYFGVQMLDPVLAPLYLVTLPLGMVGKGLTTGKAVASAATRTGAYTAAEATAIEGVLQAVDPTRTADESAATIAASAVMGSVFGAAGQAVMQQFGKKIVPAHKETKEIIKQADISARAADGDSVGAASIKPTLQGEKLLTNPTKYITLPSPTLRLLQDDVSASASNAVDLLVPHNLMKVKHQKGQAPVDTPLYSAIMQERETATAQIVLAVNKAKADLGKNGKKYTADEIGTMIGQAARRGDKAAEPELQPAVDAFRKSMDDWGDRAVRAGVVTREALDEIDSYFPRLYDTRKISQNYSRWETLITRHFANKYPDLEPAELQDIAASIHNQLMSVPVNQMHVGGFTAPSKVLVSGNLKARRLDISDVDLEEFLVDDARYVTQHYVRTMAPSVLAREQFGADQIQMIEGYPVIQSILDDMDAEYKIAKQKIAKQGKSTKKIDDQYIRANRDMRYLMSSVLGYGNPEQGMVQGKNWGRIASSEIRSFTAASTLGGMSLAAIPDMANLVLAHGLGNLFRSMPAILTPRKITNSAKADFDSFGIGLDTILSTRMLRMADIEDKLFNAFDRGIGGQTVATGAFKVFGANLWNSWMKRAAATASQNRLLSDVTKYSRLSKSRKAKLATLGIDERVANRMAKNFNAQSTKKRQGVNYADLETWDDRTANLFQRILFRDVETTIVTPQAGDMPRILDNSVGLMVGQFKRFVMAHQLQIMSQASQRLAAGDLAVLNYIVAMSGLALTSDYLRRYAKSGFDADETNKEWKKLTPSDVVFTAIDRAAGLSFGTDLLMGIDGLTDGKTNQMLGMSEQAHYTPYGLGLESRVPGLGYVSKGTRTVGAVADQVSGSQPFNKKDLHAVRQMVPLQNTFYLSWLFDALEEGTGDMMNLPESGTANRGKKRYTRN
jgi:hypothetical protein